MRERVVEGVAGAIELRSLSDADSRLHAPPSRLAYLSVDDVLPVRASASIRRLARVDL